MGAFLKKAVKFLGSFQLAFVLLVLLGVLTLLGTLAQVDMSLYDVQVKYFESPVLVHMVGPVPVPLPGGYLLLSIFFVNIVIGGLIRIRKGKSTVGILIAHVGIVFLLFGSFIEHQMSSKGSLTLWAPETYQDTNGNGRHDPGEPFSDSNGNGVFDDGEVGSEYRSANEWEVAVTEFQPDGSGVEYVIPQKHFVHLADGESTRYQQAGLPFDVVLSGFARNGRPRPVSASEARDGIGIDGFVLLALDPVGAGEDHNWPGIIASLQPKGGGETQSAIICKGIQREAGIMPWPVMVGDRRFEVELRNQKWDMPFSIRLNKFVHVRHAGISMPKEFSSYVTKIQDGQVRDVHITMNAPLRHQGVTIYQSGWGPPNAMGPRARFYSTFSVVENPSDRVPMWACIVIAIGLLWHFLRRLVLHLKAEARRRAAPAPGGKA